MGASPAAGERVTAVIAIDVGNSKTDVALVAADGSVLGAVRGPTGSHQQLGAERATATLVSLVEEAARRAGLDPLARPIARVLASSAAGADYPSDVRLLTDHFRRAALADEIVVVNDCYGGLRAGTSRSWGVCVICGSGMNCVGVAPNGRTARFDALGVISGDWGGGRAIGDAGLAAAVRAEDGRGPATSLEHAVASHFGRSRPRAVTAALYRGEIWTHRIHEIAPLVFAAAAEGDAVARGIVDRQADEIVAWAGAAIRRLGMRRLDPDVVLAGGVFRTTEPGFYERIGAGIAAVAPRARLVRLTAPPAAGAALIGLAHLNGGAVPVDVERRLRDCLTDAVLAQR